MEDESEDHWADRLDAPASVASGLSPSDGVGVGRGVGVAGGVALGWVTKVIVCAVESGLPEAVFAPGPMVTWYCVFGARVPPVGCTASVRLPLSQEKVTLVAGAIWTASWVVLRSIGWLNATRIGCARATLRSPSTGLGTTTCCSPPGCAS